MAKKTKTIQKVPFRGRDAVAITVLWIGVYLAVMYFLTGAITSSNLIFMLVGLTFVSFSEMVRRRKNGS